MAYKKSIETRRKILNVTKELVLEKGWKDISVRDIAERAGVKNPLLYYYFKNKQGIADHLLGSLILRTLDYAEYRVPFKEDCMLSHFVYVSLYYRILVEQELYQTLYLESVHPFENPVDDIDDYDLNYMVTKQFNEILKNYGVDLEPQLLQAYTISAFAIGTSIFRSLVSGHLDMSFREALFFITRFWIISVGIDEKIFEEKLAQAIDMVMEVDLDEFVKSDDDDE
ncbi:TetR/AcrR family transcriptional regulator [Alkalibacter rhizosphaerae]|uniref:TetR/AcrR family transcriptional regulator n=1 Tax=Alkalibacter rhizosphaerae TaxID=2815577 RepID=A0A974XEB3_9FIRM|nr:TetR/AcrR family transcriptional regulator [Alkalibacter rhizosphaerae]QSX08279.1 TetR/AcrR family transcriptional regulator [Alkalibacter rhizosphaerae]